MRFEVCRRLSMPSSNVVEVILCRDKLQWGAFWKLLEWLLDPSEGHGLGSQIEAAMLSFTFERSFSACLLKRECKFRGVYDEKEWRPDLAMATPSFESPTHLILIDD